MSPLTAYRLHFTLEALQPLTLPEPRGAALRGALLQSLWRQHGETKPGSTLAVFSADEPGEQSPRPYTIEPPLTASAQYAAGQQLTFGLTLFAGAHDLVPYLIEAVRQWQTVGLGARQSALDGQRGRVRLLRVLAENPLTTQRQVLWEVRQQSDRQPDLSPALAITAAHVATAAQQWLLDRRAVVRLTFHTPTRLIARGQLVRSPQPRVLVARLVQRLHALGRAFGASDTPGLPGDDPKALLTHADAITLHADETAWVDQWSPSRRLRRTTPIGGFVGRACWEGERAAMRAMLPLLLWGSIVHVGKDTVKGNGWYDLIVP